MTCYLRNGTASPEAIPCDYNAAAQGRHTNCCNPNDLCLSNGMCRSSVVNNLTNYAWFWGCTDPTYTDPVCGNYCDKWSTTNHQLAFSCEETDTWCCYNGAGVDQKPGERINRTNTKCCSISEQRFQAPWPTIVATAKFSGTPLAIATLVGSGTATSSPNTSQSSTNSLAIGLGVGLGGAAALIALALGWLFLRRRKRRNSEAELMSEYRPGMPAHSELPGQDRGIAEVESNEGWVGKGGKEKMSAVGGVERVELETTELSRELSGDVYRAELPGSPVGEGRKVEGK